MPPIVNGVGVREQLVDRDRQPEVALPEHRVHVDLHLAARCDGGRLAVVVLPVFAARHRDRVVGELLDERWAIGGAHQHVDVGAEPVGVALVVEVARRAALEDPGVTDAGSRQPPRDVDRR